MLCSDTQESQLKSSPSSRRFDLPTSVPQWGMPPLSPEAERRVSLLFGPDEQEKARFILVEECGYNIPGAREGSTEVTTDRVRFAVLKLSRGKLNILQSAVDAAKVDYRDVLLWAGFATNPHAHTSWLPKRMW